MEKDGGGHPAVDPVGFRDAVHVRLDSMRSLVAPLLLVVAACGTPIASVPPAGLIPVAPSPPGAPQSSEFSRENSTSRTASPQPPTTTAPEGATISGATAQLRDLDRAMEL